MLLSQSGAGMSGILDCEERLDFSFAASTGQELCLAVEDYLDFVLDQPQTRVIGLFLETSRHPARFVAALDKARRRAIPIVAIKVGTTGLAAKLALSHSGALAGSDASYQAIFDTYGVQRVDDMKIPEHPSGFRFGQNALPGPEVDRDGVIQLHSFNPRRGTPGL